MSAGKFTPGPWEACEPGDYFDYDGRSVVILGDGAMIRVAVVLGDDEESVANARIMAASLSMLEALRDILIDVDLAGEKTTITDIDAHLERIRVATCAAIANATGDLA